MALNTQLVFTNVPFQHKHGYIRDGDVPYNGYVGLLLFLTDRGRLKTSSHPAGNYKPMLPKNENDKDCHGDDRTVFCFKAGKHSLRPTINVSTRVSALA